MLESIYNMGGGKQQSPLARYLASAGGRGAPGYAQPGKIMQPGQALVAPEVGQAGSFTPQPPPQTGHTPGPAGAMPVAPPSLPGISTDYTSDPALQQILSGNIKDEADAEAAALAAQRTTLGRYGDKNLAMAILGENDPTIGSISDDPNQSTSTLARLHRGFSDTSKQIDDADSAGNVFYGGQHVTNRANLAKDEQTQEADANAAVHDALDQIAGGLRNTKSSIASTRATAEQDAADRAAQAAMLQALLGAGSTGGTPPPPPVGAPTSVDAGAAAASGAPVDAAAITTPGGPGLVDPGFYTTNQKPIDLGNGFAYDPSTGKIIPGQPNRV